jgi:hypothetical protein
MQTLLRNWWSELMKTAIKLVAAGPHDHVHVNHWHKR